MALEWLSAPSHIDRNSEHAGAIEIRLIMIIIFIILKQSITILLCKINQLTIILFSILKPFYKRILIVDDNTDITLTFKSALEESYDDKRFEVYAYNNPLVALSEFKPHFHDLLLTDINMPEMNGFQLCGPLKHLLL